VAGRRDPVVWYLDQEEIAQQGRCLKFEFEVLAGKVISSTAARKALTVIRHLRGTLKVASGLVVVHPAPVDWSLVHPLLLTRNPVAGPAASVGLARSIKLAKTATLTPDLGLMPVYSEGTTPDVKPPLVT
jgi:hypothetical protein